MKSARPNRVGLILAVADFAASVRFYTEVLGFELREKYDDPPYATLTSCGTRLSLAEQGHDAEDRPGVEFLTPADPSRASAMVVIEVDDAVAAFEELRVAGVEALAPVYHPPWGGSRFFCLDPDGYLIEFETPA
ncbi:MAG TPA: VOC family protein [Acidimicrobiales bacterium]|nr:VOC family protein [Acidimicrobiales bacterium]